MALPEPKYWTYADVQRLPEDGKRYEVIDGVLYVSPAPRTIHQLLSRRLQFFFYQFELEEAGYIYNAPTDLRMDGCDPVEPDLIFLTADQCDQIQDKWIDGPPYLLVEILSPKSGSRDRVKKLRKYAQNKVPFYLIVDPKASTFEVLELDGETYRLTHALEPGESWTFRGKTLDLTQLFAPLKRAATAEEG